MSRLSKSPWIIHYDASSCNGCDIEVLACLTPVFDVERLGVINTGNPKHADIFLVTGAVNEQCRSVICNIYAQMPEPKVVVAVGACASTGGIFSDCYNISGGIDSVIPVDVFVPGCAARPEAIIDGVVQALGVLEKKQKEMAAALDARNEVFYRRADKSDAPQILALQKTASLEDLETYGEGSVPVMLQSLTELQQLLEQPDQVFIKAVVNGKIIGTVSAQGTNGRACLNQIHVHPYFRERNIGSRLIEEMEKAFPATKRFEARAGHKSRSILSELQQLGYQEFKTEAFTPAMTWVYVQKGK